MTSCEVIDCEEKPFCTASKFCLEHYDDEKEDLCIICADVFKDKLLDPCKHMIHIECIYKTGKDICPVCTIPVNLSEDERKKIKVINRTVNYSRNIEVGYPASLDDTGSENVYIHPVIGTVTVLLRPYPISENRHLFERIFFNERHHRISSYSSIRYPPIQQTQL